MSERSLRGTRLGADELRERRRESSRRRSAVVYDCPQGHSFTMPFSVEADVPARWECRICGQRSHRAATVPAPGGEASQAPRTHWDMLLERRSIPELEELLEERLELLRASGGPARRSA